MGQSLDQVELALLELLAADVDDQQTAVVNAESSAFDLTSLRVWRPEPD